MSRKKEIIIQIVVSGANLIALTNNGNLYGVNTEKGNKWIEMEKPKNLSQEKEEEK